MVHSEMEPSPSTVVPDGAMPVPEVVPGFCAWMQALKLSAHIVAGSKWVEEVGACSLDEIHENWEEFADALNLKRLERNRLERGAPDIVLVSSASDEAQLADKGKGKGNAASDEAKLSGKGKGKGYYVLDETQLTGKGKGKGDDALSAPPPPSVSESNKRPCRYGLACRGISNAEHGAMYSHPGKDDVVAESNVTNSRKREIRLRPCKYGDKCREKDDAFHIEQYSHPGQELEVSQDGDQHVGTQFPHVLCQDHPGCPRRRTCRWSHGLVHNAAKGSKDQVSVPLCFLGQSPHNQSCRKPTWNGEPFEFCSRECRDKAMETPKGPDGCCRKDCPCPCTINGSVGQYCCEACAKGKACRAPRHTAPTAHLVAVAKPVAGKYAPCARAGCSCAQEGGSSWDGNEGQYCCRACRRGTPCTKLWHTVPVAVAAANTETRYVGDECPLAGCAKPPWNGRPGEYCCKEHRRADQSSRRAKDAAKALEVSPGTFPDYAALWMSADAWARANGSGATKGPVTAVYLNECLADPTCPARVSFERAVKRCGLRNWTDGEFGWHGTRSMDGLQGICWSNWDTQRRAGQACGPGEYFSRGTLAGLHYSESYASGDAANFLIVAYVISSRQARPVSTAAGGTPGSSGHMVCSNPVKNGNKSTGEMYCIPIAVVAFGKTDARPKFRTSSS